MEEIFEIIKAINRLKDNIKDLNSKIDILSEKPALKIPPAYLDEAETCKLLRIRPRTLARLRESKVIAYYKSGNRNLYLHADIQEYLDKNCRNK